MKLCFTPKTSVSLCKPHGWNTLMLWVESGWGTPSGAQGFSAHRDYSWWCSGYHSYVVRGLNPVRPQASRLWTRLSLQSFLCSKVVSEKIFTMRMFWWQKGTSISRLFLPIWEKLICSFAYEERCMWSEALQFLCWDCFVCFLICAIFQLIEDGSAFQ